ncbi:hypothetical protein VTI74DRAFT_965 [Chaetomium olivicolor]
MPAALSARRERHQRNLGPFHPAPEFMYFLKKKILFPFAVGYVALAEESRFLGKRNWTMKFSQVPVDITRRDWLLGVPRTHINQRGVSISPHSLEDLNFDGSGLLVSLQETAWPANGAQGTWKRSRAAVSCQMPLLPVSDGAGGELRMKRRHLICSMMRKAGKTLSN